MDADLIGESASTVRECREVRGHIHVHRIQTSRVHLSYSVVTLEMKKANLVFKLGKQYRLSRPGSPRCLFTGTVKRSHIATRAACLLWTFARGDESVCVVLLVNVLLLCLVGVML